TMWALGGLLGPLSTGIALWQKYRLLGSVAAPFPKVATGVRNLGVALRFLPLNPICLAITAMATLAYLVYTNWDKIKAAFSSGVAWVKGLLNGLPGWMKSIGVAMMQGLLAAINPLALGAKLIQMAKNGIASFKK